MTKAMYPPTPSVSAVEASLGECPAGHGKAYLVQKGRCAYPPCGHCWVARKRATKEQVARRARGTLKEYVPTRDTRLRLISLRQKYGYSQFVIARIVGCHPSTLREIQNGVAKRTGADVAAGVEKLFRDRSDRSNRWKNRVEVDRARRAVQGLMWGGHPQWWIAEQVGYSANAIAHVCAKSTWVTVDLEDKILAVARSVDLTQYGPSVKTRSIALRRGYKSLAFWDDI